MDYLITFIWFGKYDKQSLHADGKLSYSFLEFWFSFPMYGDISCRFLTFLKLVGKIDREVFDCLGGEILLKCVGFKILEWHMII